MKTCKHAHDGMSAWLCYHWNGRITPGTELRDNEDECRACKVKTAHISDQSF
jgi:hypothetical protein